MNKLFAVSIVGILLLFALGTLRPEPFDPVAYERQQIAIARAQQLAPIETFTAAIWLILPLAATIIVLMLAALWGVAAVIRFRHERHPDSRGLLPINAYQLDAVAPHALGAYHGTQQIEAARQPVPHTISYSPRVDYRSDGSRLPELPVNEPAAQLPAPPIPSFAKLLTDGRVGRGNPLLLGYDQAGQPVEGTWLQLYSTAVGGISGSGKTWTATFLAAQAALFGARIVLLDPHAGNLESLAHRLAPMKTRFVCEVASDPPQLRAAVALVAAELARRKAQKGSGEPWLFIVDEFSALQRGELAEPLSKLVEGLGQEGRKLGIYAMVCGQVWSAARSGGTELRDSLASAYVHRLRPAQARMLTGLSTDDLPHDLLQLPAGCAYLLDTAGELRRVTIPQMSAEDVTQVAQLLGASESPSTPRPLGFRPQRVEGAREGALEGTPAAPLPPHQEAENWTPEEAAIIAALKGGKTPGEVAQQLAGATGGRKYQEAARKVAEVIRRALVKDEV